MFVYLFSHNLPSLQYDYPKEYHTTSSLSALTEHTRQFNEFLTDFSSFLFSKHGKFIKWWVKLVFKIHKTIEHWNGTYDSTAVLLFAIIVVDWHGIHNTNNGNNCDDEWVLLAINFGLWFEAHSPLIFMSQHFSFDVFVVNFNTPNRWILFHEHAASVTVTMI